MEDISVIISTQTPKGVKRQKAKVNKSKGFVTVNGIVVPKVKSFGALTMTTISSIVVDPDKAKATAEDFLKKIELGKIAKKASGETTATKRKRRKKSATKVATKKSTKAKPSKKAKKPQPERLPKHEYFLKRAMETYDLGDWEKTEYYLGRLEEFDLNEEQKQLVAYLTDLMKAE